MTEKTFYPTFRYHQTLAPEGKRFTDEVEFGALGPGWVDTPAKFVQAEPEPSGDQPEKSEGVRTKPKKAAKEPA